MTMKGAGKRLAGKGREVVVTGLDEIDRRLRLLEPRMQKEHVRKAMRLGMKLVQAQARANAPVGTGPTKGSLKKAIKVRALKSRRRGTLGIEVRIGKEGDYQGKQFYGAFVEFGTSKAEPHPFMLPAYVEQGEAAKSTTMNALLEGLDAEVRALGGS